MLKHVTNFVKTMTSSVSVVTGYRLDSQVTIPGRDKRFFVHSTVSRLALGPTQPPVQWVWGAVSLGLKQLGHEADHSPPSSSEVKNGGAIPSFPHASSWHGAKLIKHGDNCTVTFFYV
jgi:hypothetical protein